MAADVLMTTCTPLSGAHRVTLRLKSRNNRDTIQWRFRKREGEIIIEKKAIYLSPRHPVHYRHIYSLLLLVELFVSAPFFGKPHEMKGIQIYFNFIVAVCTWMFENHA